MAKGETYEEFVAKFKPKNTTDDCFTPPSVYDAVKDWACREYGIDPACIVRPFWPGGDYQNFDYPDGCVVLDNPPFSILSKICDYYLFCKIPFFLFAPSLTAFSGRKNVMRTNHIICDAEIEYANGAVVRTAFVTSFGGDVVAQTCPELGQLLDEAVEAAKMRKSIPKYDYSDHVVTAALLQRYSKYGIEWKIRRGDCAVVSALDEQRRAGKAIFGGGLLLSDRAAAKKAAAAERADKRCWRLSERELAMVANMGREEDVPEQMAMDC